MICVIIPAHNEANVIAKAIRALLPVVILGEVELTVVCNGISRLVLQIVAVGKISQSNNTV